MKKTIFSFLLIASLFTACNEDQSPDSEDSVVEFNGKNAVIKSDNMSNLRFKNLPGSVSLDDNTPEGQIRVEASEDLSRWLEAKSEGGELRLEGKAVCQPHSTCTFTSTHAL